jgi:hypothetical protein
MGGMELVIDHPNLRMGDTVVACKNGIRPSILTCGWLGENDVLIGATIFAYWWHGGRVQECSKTIHFDVWAAWR